MDGEVFIDRAGAGGAGVGFFGAFGPGRDGKAHGGGGCATHGIMA